MNATMMKIIAFLLASLWGFISCSTVKPEEPEIPNEIVLIFRQAKIRGKECKLEYVDDRQIIRAFSPDSSLRDDTIFIQTVREEVEFVHSYRSVFDRLTYLFNRGDTVLFTYEDEKPLVEVLNRSDSSLWINYDLFWREQLDSSGLPAYRKSYVYEWMKLPRESKSVQAEAGKISIADMREKVRQEVHEELIKEVALLDSLKKQGQIASEIYDYRKLKALLQMKGEELEWSLNCFSRFQTEEQIKPSDVMLSEMRDGIESILFKNLLSKENDRLIFQYSYRELLIRYFAFYGRKVKRTTKKHSHNGQPGGLINQPDFLARYDSIAQSSWFSPAAKKVMLRWELENIIENQTPTEMEEYLGKFEESYSDSSVLALLSEKYSLQQLGKRHKHDLELVSIDGQTLLFQDLLEKHRGKVIYFDFWSSSCRPCIKEFPYSQQLKQKYKDDQLVFVYVSLDIKQANWSRSCEKYNLDSESYLITNKYTSNEFRALKVNWIPHYMIYDKSGQQVVEYAPRPSEAETVALLNQYL